MFHCPHHLEDIKSFQSICCMSIFEVLTTLHGPTSQALSAFSVKWAVRKQSTRWRIGALARNSGDTSRLLAISGSMQCNLAMQNKMALSVRSHRGNSAAKPCNIQSGNYAILLYLCENWYGATNWALFVTEWYHDSNVIDTSVWVLQLDSLILKSLQKQGCAHPLNKPLLKI